MTTIVETQTTDQFADRVFGSVIGALDTWAMYVGDKLGLYEHLAASSSTRDELVAATGMHPRYADEWLEHQVTGGVLGVDDHTLAPETRRYHLTPGAREVLADKDSVAYLASFIRLVTAGGIQLPALIDAYRTGSGVSWAQFGEDMRTGQAEMNRPWFLSELGDSWFPSIPDLHDRLEQGGRVADVGCGEGWSSIGLALAYPGVTVDGYDVDVPSIDAARRHARAYGLEDRVRFHAVDAAELNGEYDVVTAFECIHDLPHPVEVLAAMNRLAADDGIVVVMDEAVGDAFGHRTDEIERLMYGFSLFICLPDGMSHPESVATGTVMRPETFGTYAQRAGFSSVEVLPIENDLWRFYRLER